MPEHIVGTTYREERPMGRPSLPSRAISSHTPITASSTSSIHLQWHGVRRRSVFLQRRPELACMWTGGRLSREDPSEECTNFWREDVAVFRARTRCSDPHCQRILACPQFRGICDDICVRNIFDDVLAKFHVVVDTVVEFDQCGGHGVDAAESTPCARPVATPLKTRHVTMSAIVCLQQVLIWSPWSRLSTMRQVLGAFPPPTRQRPG